MEKVRQYTQRFRKEWLKQDIFANWLLECPADATKAVCKYCRCEIKAKLCDLSQHAKTKKHIKAIEPFSSSRSRQSILNAPVKTLKDCIAEARLAMFVCNHSAILSVDHLGLLCKDAFNESSAAINMKIHRTKCSGIILCVLYPHFQQDLLKSIQSDSGFHKYSLFLDESTDITIKKILAIGINYFDTDKGEVISTFLTLTELNFCDAESLAVAVKETLNIYKLPLQNLIGIATDNCSTMIGINNGLYQKLKIDVPNLILIKCVCHSLQLAVSHATSNTLPRVLEYLVSETYNWFSRSSIRKYDYNQLYKTLNDGKEPKKIVQASNTRWLSIESAISSILDQYSELKAHFEIVRTSEKCYNAELLYSMYKDEINLLYLSFLKPILRNIQQVNKAFEANNVDPLKLFNDLILLINSISKMIVLPSHKIDPIKNDIEPFIDHNPYLGYGFESKIKHLKEENKISTEEEKNVRSRCKHFLLSLYKEIKQRLPDNIHIFEKMYLFSVENILKHQKMPITPLLIEINIDHLKISQIEIEYNKMHLVKWNNVNHTVHFWGEVYKYRDAVGENPFKNIADIALLFLVLPVSNAEVERIFSQLNLIKNKTRNNLSLNMVNAILCVRYGLIRHGKCCHNYELPKNVLNLIGTNKAYPQKYENFEINDLLFHKCFM